MEIMEPSLTYKIGATVVILLSLAPFLAIHYLEKVGSWRRLYYVPLLVGFAFMVSGLLFVWLDDDYYLWPTVLLRVATVSFFAWILFLVARAIIGSTKNSPGRS